MNSVILIPARYASSRYPGKPLVQIKGSAGAAKPLIVRSVDAIIVSKLAVCANAF